MNCNWKDLKDGIRTTECQRPFYVTTILLQAYNA
jgi:hypothetical protein